MSTNTKMFINTKQDGGYNPLRTKLIKSPKDSQVLRPNVAVKVKKETDLVKRESGSPVQKDLLVKKPLETPVKRDSEAFLKTVKVKKEIENVNVVKKEPHSVNREKASQVIGNFKSVKKAEVAISRGNATSSTNVASKKKMTSKEEPEKKKKVYDLPGQKHDPPEERDPLRIFYESLYQQNPKSEMAEVWMMEHGLLAFDAAKKAFERKKKSQLGQKMGSPVKPVKDVKFEKTSSKNVTIKIEKKSPTLNGDSKFLKAKRKLDSDDDDDFILKPKKKFKTNA